LNPAKSFPITKHQVWEAYKRVKANHGGAGIDAQTLEKFDQDLSNNLYKLWMICSQTGDCFMVGN